MSRSFELCGMKHSIWLLECQMCPWYGSDVMTIDIPARYGSTCFSGKPLARLAGKPMIRHVYENAYKVNGCKGVIVATDIEQLRAVENGIKIRMVEVECKGWV